jgi:hypothetical protein
VKILKNNSTTDSYTTNAETESTGGDWAESQTAVIPVVQGDVFTAAVFAGNSRTIDPNDHSWFAIEVVEGDLLTVTQELTAVIEVIGPQGYTGSQGIPGEFAALGYTGSQASPALVPNVQETSYTLLSSDIGKYINITTGGITVPANTFADGDVVSIYNNSSSTQTITQGSNVTMYLVGTAITGDRSISQRGLVTLLCVGTNEFVITGGGIT